ncbi:MAG: 23S rRNA (adenine(2030)-N(6))-methyltransferase RlmJ [Brevundimonas sp.]|jgi:23S rRNA (adenine2030-N6)-methyltransferase|uniref:23S rRNA (adenine(2030)-N(6))-methyltransferase RlmJ n=1 Tax=Brevundimonas sp. TaxID=1871086 RepID=UPI00391AEFAE
MNYRHAYHAGNFADLLKHALVLWLLERMPRPLAVIDTHAGAGLYDLGDGTQARSREAEAGIGRLMGAPRASMPGALRMLAERVERLNDAEVRLYPGSPRLIVGALAREDSYCGFELNPEVLALLERVLADHDNAHARGADGYDGLMGEVRAEKASNGLLVLIDPPFERADDYVRSAEALRGVVDALPDAVVALWTPLKDMETFDGCLRRIEGMAAPVSVIETRLRPLTNPMKMNGCAMIIANAPKGLDDEGLSVARWIAQHLGEAGAEGRTWRL